MPRRVFGLGVPTPSGNGQWLAFAGFEVLGYGRVSKMVAPDELRGRLAKWSRSEGAQTRRSSVSKVMSLPAAGRAAVEGAVVEGVEGDAEIVFNRIWIRCSVCLPWYPHARRNSRQP